MKLILASKSPRRKKVLEENGYEVIVDVSNADEDSVKSTSLNLRDKVIRIATLKAGTVAKKHKDGIILAADTMVYFEGHEIGQQDTKDSAFKTLKKLLGKTHEVYTGICILVIKNNNVMQIIQDSELSKVKLKKISDEAIRKYVDAGHYAGKAGAYNVDDKEFESYVDIIDGSKTNVMGLPIEKVKEMLKKAR
jgi:septum formation protein